MGRSQVAEEKEIQKVAVITTSMKDEEAQDQDHLTTRFNDSVDDEVGLLNGNQTARSEKEVEMTAIEVPLEDADPQTQCTTDSESAPAEKKETEIDKEVSKSADSFGIL